MPQLTYDCAVIGNWHLAFTTATSLASLGRKVLLVDPSPTPSVAPGEFPPLPVSEPGMAEAIATARARGLLDYRTGVPQAMSGDWTAAAAWLAIDTPVNERDEADVTTLVQAVEQLHARGHASGLLVVSSQIPLGFSDRLRERFGFRVAYVPENLRLGKGLETFLKADRTVIGATDARTSDEVRRLLEGVQTDFFTCDLVTSEMVKHATNAFLATSISFANEMARIGEAYGVDNVAVGKALKLDKRIGKGAYVVPGLGFAGGTLPRDLRALQKLSQARGQKSPLVDAVLDINESTADALVIALRYSIASGAELKGKRILILGYTYKAETNTLRRSSSLVLATELKKQGAEIVGYDPVMNAADLSPLDGLMRHAASLDDLPAAIDAAVLMTARPEFAQLDWDKLRRSFHKSAFVLDARAHLDGDAVVRAGLGYKALWQPVRAGASA